jgi:hypothetical protein
LPENPNQTENFLWKVFNFFWSEIEKLLKMALIINRWNMLQTKIYLENENEFFFGNQIFSFELENICNLLNWLWQGWGSLFL